MTQLVEMYTDGACRGNPGKGGWGVLLRYGEAEKALYGGEKAHWAGPKKRPHISPSFHPN